MYACLHASPAGKELLDLALSFSPYVEQTVPGTVIFSIDPLRRLLGSVHQIASEISRAGYERKLRANLAIAGNPDTAILAARHFPGITLIPAGEERHKLGSIALDALDIDPAVLGILLRWGLKTCEDLAALPELGVAERLGPAGVHLRGLALGTIHRPLRLMQEPTGYERRVELDYPVETLEPLLFLFSGVLNELCLLLRSQSQAAQILAIDCEREAQDPYRAALEFPVPLSEHRAMLKLLQLHMERHPPGAAIVAFKLRIQPVEPQRAQGGIFLPQAPLPGKLQITLSRLAGLVGDENVGAAQLLNTRRPDAFKISPFNLTAAIKAPEDSQSPAETIRLAIRIFRPALQARVRIVELAPRDITAPGVKGKVLRSSGPWKTSGEWWAVTAWSREEWDVALDNGALYRIYRESKSHEWFVQGIYD